MTIQMARNTSLSRKWKSITKSAFERNLKARASSRNPRTTFTELSQPPDCGSELSQPGKAAKSANGRAIAKLKPNRPIIGAVPPLVAASTSKLPSIGPVQENDTSASTNAIKKIPINPPLSAFESALVIEELGRVISKAPRNAMANTIDKTKKARLNQGSVDISDNTDAPKAAVTATPRIT